MRAKGILSGYEERVLTKTLERNLRIMNYNLTNAQLPQFDTFPRVKF